LGTKNSCISKAPDIGYAGIRAKAKEYSGFEGAED
jgi:hypothetical protein